MIQRLWGWVPPELCCYGLNTLKLSRLYRFRADFTVEFMQVEDRLPERWLIWLLDNWLSAELAWEWCLQYLNNPVIVVCTSTADRNLFSRLLMETVCQDKNRESVAATLYSLFTSTRSPQTGGHKRLLEGCSCLSFLSQLYRREAVTSDLWPCNVELLSGSWSWFRCGAQKAEVDEPDCVWRLCLV